MTRSVTCFTLYQGTHTTSRSRPLVLVRPNTASRPAKSAARPTRRLPTGRRQSGEITYYETPEIILKIGRAESQVNRWVQPNCHPVPVHGRPQRPPADPWDRGSVQNHQPCPITSLTGRPPKHRITRSGTLSPK